jgi:Lrp/AsnC family leucine-responsive transcriptional regulator
VGEITVDEIDRHLLTALRENARIPFAELGRQVALSGPSVQERVRRLEERGIVTGFHAAVDAAAVGMGVSALIGVWSADGAEIDDVARRLRGLLEIEDCWFVAGDENFVLKVRAADVAALEHVVAKLRRLRGVARTRTTVVLSTRWEGRPTPLPDGPG